MDEGTYEPALRPLPPARHSEPFRMIEEVSLETSAIRAQPASDDQSGSPAVVSGNRRADSGAAAARAKKTSPKPGSGPHPQPAPAPARGNFFQRLFHLRPAS
jgi:hypothetical protein